MPKPKSALSPTCTKCGACEWGERSDTLARFCRPCYRARQRVREARLKAASASRAP